MQCAAAVEVSPLSGDRWLRFLADSEILQYRSSQKWPLALFPIDGIPDDRVYGRALPYGMAEGPPEGQVAPRIGATVGTSGVSPRCRLPCDAQRLSGTSAEPVLY